MVILYLNTTHLKLHLTSLVLLLNIYQLDSFNILNSKTAYSKYISKEYFILIHSMYLV